VSIDDVLRRLEAAEREFVSGSEVLAPVLRGRGVVVRIAGIRCRLRVDDASFEGWAVLHPLAIDSARIERPARLTEVRAYLRLFPALRLIALARQGRAHMWLAAPANTGDARVHLAEPAPVFLVEDGIQPFETVVARFDGNLFWYERRDGRRNPALGSYLREALSAQVAPADLRKRGLSAEERAAYVLSWTAAEQARRGVEETRLAGALEHAGARLVSFVERPESYTVTYTSGGTRHVSTVGKGDLTVLTAGICLSGRDRDFDLTSLVSVLHEAEGRPIPRWNVTETACEDDDHE
jgi:hypothetical protein